MLSFLKPKERRLELQALQISVALHNQRYLQLLWLTVAGITLRPAMFRFALNGRQIVIIRCICWQNCIICYKSVQKTNDPRCDKTVTHILGHKLCCDGEGGVENNIDSQCDEYLRYLDDTFLDLHFLLEVFDDLRCFVSTVISFLAQCKHLMLSLNIHLKSHSGNLVRQTNILISTCT